MTRRHSRRRFLGTVGATVSGAVLAGCTTEDEPTPTGTPVLASDSPEPTPTATDAPTTTEPDVPAEQRHEVGESFVVDGQTGVRARYSATDPRTSATVRGTPSAMEAEGLFLLVTLSVTNVGQEPFEVDQGMYKLVGPDCERYGTEEAVMVETKSTFVSAFLEPGIIKEGRLVYDVPVETRSGWSLDIRPTQRFASGSVHRIQLGTLRDTDATPTDSNG